MTRHLKAYLLSLLALLSGCTMKGLDREIQRAHDSYGYLKLELPRDIPAGVHILAAVYQTAPDMELVNVRTGSPGGSMLFLLPQASYTVVAFADSNGDFIYQPGEAATYHSAVPLVTSVSQDTENAFESFPGLALQLSVRDDIPMEVDLSVAALSTRVQRAKENFLNITDWNNPKFSEESTRKGMWEPLSFEEDIGYGLYLLEPLDPNRELIVFVHGINGSPRQFQAMAESLSPGFQVALFQYPSAFPLEHSAYILKTGLTEMLVRHPIRALHVVAHSMGGLVSRGALVTLDPQVSTEVEGFISLATPWLGHAAAQAGVAWSPTVAPVWRSMVPNSGYQQHIFSVDLPATTQHHLIFTYAKKAGGPSEGDDGVVTVASQLGRQAQSEAESVFGIDDNHNGVLENPLVIAQIKALLSEDSKPHGCSELSC